MFDSAVAAITTRYVKTSVLPDGISRLPSPLPCPHTNGPAGEPEGVAVNPATATVSMAAVGVKLVSNCS